MQIYGSFTFKSEHVWETLGKIIFLENVTVTNYKNWFFAHDVSSPLLKNVSPSCYKDN